MNNLNLFYIRTIKNNFILEQLNIKNFGTTKYKNFFGTIKYITFLEQLNIKTFLEQLNIKTFLEQLNI